MQYVTAKKNPTAEKFKRFFQTYQKTLTTTLGCVKIPKIFVNLLERYSRGRRGRPAKALGLETVARVQIPLSPPGALCCVQHLTYKQKDVIIILLRGTANLVKPRTLVQKDTKTEWTPKPVSIQRNLFQSQSFLKRSKFCKEWIPTLCGELAERSKAAVLKTVDMKVSWGSNP